MCVRERELACLRERGSELACVCVFECESRPVCEREKES